MDGSLQSKRFNCRLIIDEEYKNCNVKADKSNFKISSMVLIFQSNYKSLSKSQGLISELIT